MSLINVKRFIPLFLLILFVVCSPTVFAQDKDWRQISFGELQSKTLELEPQTDGEIILGEVPDFDNSVDFSAKHYARADVSITREQYDKATDISELTKTIEHGVMIDELNEQDVFKREPAGTGELEIKANLFAAPNTKSDINSERRYRELLSGDSARRAEQHTAENNNVKIVYSALDAFHHKTVNGVLGDEHRNSERWCYHDVFVSLFSF